MDYRDYYNLIMDEKTSKNRILSLVRSADFKEALVENFKEVEENVAFPDTYELFERILKVSSQTFMDLMNYLLQKLAYGSMLDFLVYYTDEQGEISELDIDIIHYFVKNTPTISLETCKELLRVENYNFYSALLERDDMSEEDLSSLTRIEVTKDIHEIIRFTPKREIYKPKSICKIDEDDPQYHKYHTEVNIPMGASRIGGPIIDLPRSISHPKDLFFVAQLNMSDFSKKDPRGLLPKSGFLYFFIGYNRDSGQIIYADVDISELYRVIKEHGGEFYDGCLIEHIFYATEDINLRYWEGKGKIWNEFAGTKKSKIYGIYTSCQLDEDEIKEKTFSDNVLLLQIGEDFTGSGVLSVQIQKTDLEHLNFNNCLFYWGQD